MFQLRPWIISANWLVRKGYNGFACWPFVVLKDKACASQETVNHERIHLHQQREMLVFPFYIWYFVEYAVRRFQFGSWKLAYINISFEREAYQNAHNLNYLQRRRFWAWWGYRIKTHNLSNPKPASREADRRQLE